MKHIYHTLRKIVKENIKTPTATETWINLVPFLEQENWPTIYKRTFEITKEHYL